MVIMREILFSESLPQESKRNRLTTDMQNGMSLMFFRFRISKNINQN